MCCQPRISVSYSYATLVQVVISLYLVNTPQQLSSLLTDRSSLSLNSMLLSAHTPTPLLLLLLHYYFLLAQLLAISMRQL